METKKEYIAPTLTVVSFKMEQGYAASGLLNGLRLFQDQMLFNEDYLPGYNAQAQEYWSEEGTDDSYFGTW